MLRVVILVSCLISVLCGQHEDKSGAPIPPGDVPPGSIQQQNPSNTSSGTGPSDNTTMETNITNGFEGDAVEVTPGGMKNFSEPVGGGSGSGNETGEGNQTDQGGQPQIGHSKHNSATPTVIHQMLWLVLPVVFAVLRQSG